MNSALALGIGLAVLLHSGGVDGCSVTPCDQGECEVFTQGSSRTGQYEVICAVSQIQSYKVFRGLNDGWPSDAGAGCGQTTDGMTTTTQTICDPVTDPDTIMSTCGGYACAFCKDIGKCIWSIEQTE